MLIKQTSTGARLSAIALASFFSWAVAGAAFGKDNAPGQRQSPTTTAAQKTAAAPQTAAGQKTAAARQTTRDAATQARVFRQPKADQNPPGIDARQVMVFVRQHHPELEVFLGELQDKHPRVFARAVNDIARSVVRLEDLQKRNPQSYEIAVHNWKIDSRIKLMATQYAFQPSAARKQQLTSLVEQQLELQYRRAVAERERLLARLTKLDQALADYDAGKQAEVARRVEQLVNKAANQLKRLRGQKQSNQKDDARSNR